MAATAEGKNWVDLEVFAQRELSSYRKASFWTPFALRRKGLVRYMAKAGVAADWILKRSVIVRVDLQQLLALNLRVAVPTVLDGYTYPVFFPRRTSAKPAWGRAIDLGQEPFKLGLKEVVVPPAPVSLFKLKPVIIESLEKAGVVKELIDSMRPLEEFYEKTAESAVAKVD